MATRTMSALEIPKQATIQAARWVRKVQGPIPAGNAIRLRSKEVPHLSSRSNSHDGLRCVQFILQRNLQKCI